MEPPNIYCDSDLHDFDFSPTDDQLVLSLAECVVEIHAFSPEKTHLRYRGEAGPRAARLTRFSPSGQRLIFGGDGLQVFDNETCTILGSHSLTCDLYECCFVAENILAVSSDEGKMSVMDIRNFEVVYASSLTELGTSPDHGFVFTQLISSRDGTYLFAPASDGTLYTFDLRRPANARDKLFARTGGYEEELTCVASLGPEKQLICGTATGHLQLYKWGLFGHFADRVKTPASEVISLAVLDDETLVVGGDDGRVQLWRFNPHRLCLLEPHADEGEEPLPIERVAISRCKRILGSIAHDRALKFYDLTELGTFETAVSEEGFVRPRALRKERPEPDFFKDIE